MSGPVIALAAVLGAASGRVASLVVERVPLDDPSWRTPHACPGCGAARARRSWIPVVGPVAAGPCSTCDERLPRWEPLLDLVLAATAALMADHFARPAEVVAYALFAWVLVVLSAIDLRTLRLPDRLTLPAFVLGVPLLAAVGALTDRLGSLVPALVGAGAYFGVLLLAHLVHPRGMGFGDVKLALSMGLFLGFLRPTSLGAFQLVLHAMVLGFAAGSVAGLAVVVVRRRSAPYPFGPFLAGGTIVAIALSRSIAS